jgi:hypothetical protein
MPTKEFLPRAIPLVDLKEQLIENGPSIVRLPSKFKPCVKRVFPILGIFSLFFGSAFFGFSLVIVQEGHVGYYSTRTCVNESSHCVVKSYSPGVYFETPWRKGEFKTVDVSPRNITLGKISYINSGGDSITTATCTAEYKVVDQNMYLNALINFKSEERLENALIDDVKLKVMNFLMNGSQQPSSFNITYQTYGLLFDRVGFLME